MCNENKTNCKLTFVGIYYFFCDFLNYFCKTEAITIHNFLLDFLKFQLWLFP